jgi:hypothetical protein
MPVWAASECSGRRRIGQVAVAVTTMTAPQARPATGEGLGHRLATGRRWRAAAVAVAVA